MACIATASTGAGMTGKLGATTATLAAHRPSVLLSFCAASLLLACANIGSSWRVIAAGRIGRKNRSSKCSESASAVDSPITPNAPLLTQCQSNGGASPWVMGNRASKASRSRSTVRLVTS